MTRADLARVLVNLVAWTALFTVLAWVIVTGGCR